MSKKSSTFVPDFEKTRIMKRFFAFIAAFCFTASVMAETEFTFTTASDMSQTKDGISMVIAKGNGGTAPTVITDYQTKEPEMRVYNGNTITISGENLTNIQLVCAKSSASNKPYAAMSASNGTLVSGGEAEDKNDWKVDSWTGSATSVVFTFSGDKGQRRIQRIVIDGEPIVIEKEEEHIPTVEDLQADYVYAEPTSVAPKDTVIWKEEFAFISNNILVHCTQGSIVKAEADPDPEDEKEEGHPAYFSCNAGYDLTFTATQPIKGITIDGSVRKLFEATSDKGTIQYIDNPDADEEAWPAVVIMDINATSVTMTCPKNIHCYAVHVYFEANPEPLFPLESLEQAYPTVQATKILRDGQLYIRRDQKTYNAQGAQVF